MPKKPSTSRWDVDDPAKLARVLESAADRAAAEFLIDGSGLLQTCVDHGFREAIEELEDSEHDGPNSALHRFQQLWDALPPEVREPVQEYVYNAVTRRAISAYLFGLAVGRRIGPQPLTTKVGAR